MSREKCDHFARCGTSGHYQENGVWKRCPCLTKEIYKRQLGLMYDTQVRIPSPLAPMLEKDLRIEGTLREIRPYIAGALLELISKNKTFQVIDAYRLIEIFLEKDEEIATQTALVEKDLLVILLGFGDPPNKYLPELLNQVFARRELSSRPTWVIMGIELGSVATKYSEAVRSKISGFQKVTT